MDEKATSTLVQMKEDKQTDTAYLPKESLSIQKCVKLTIKPILKEVRELKLAMNTCEFNVEAVKN